MSTFTDAKNNIVTNIRENYTQEITGQKLQETLVGMLEYSEQSRVQISNLTGPAALVQEKRLIVNLTSDTTFRLSAPLADNYEHFYCVDILTGDTTYAVTFPGIIKWVKPLEIVPNTRHMIMIDQDLIAVWASVPLS